MPVNHAARLRALLDRYEKDHGATLRRRREDAAASAAFHQRFQELSTAIVFPCVEQLVKALRERGLPAGMSETTCYAHDIGAIKERLTLSIAEGNRTIDQALPAGVPDRDSNGHRCMAAARAPRDTVGWHEKQPGVSLVADNATRQVHLHVRSMSHPEEPQVSELPVLEQWTADLIEEELIAALEQVLFEAAADD